MKIKNVSLRSKPSPMDFSQVQKCKQALKAAFLALHNTAPDRGVLVNKACHDRWRGGEVRFGRWQLTLTDSPSHFSPYPLESCWNRPIATAKAGLQSTSLMLGPLWRRRCEGLQLGDVEVLATGHIAEAYCTGHHTHGHKATSGFLGWAPSRRLCSSVRYAATLVGMRIPATLGAPRSLVAVRRVAWLSLNWGAEPSRAADSRGTSGLVGDAILRVTHALSADSTIETLNRC